MLLRSLSCARRVDRPGLDVLLREIASHLDKVVRNHAEPNPSSHALQTGIEATT